VDRVTPTIVIVLFVALVFTGLALGWRARRRRQAGLPALDAPPASLGTPLLVDDVFYVATTVAEAPTDRIAVRGLGFRSRAVVAVHADGLVLSIAGQPDAFIPVTAISGIGRATWTIDRVVGRDGLVVVTWMLGATAVDTYFKSERPDALVGALVSLSPLKESS
jgi:hypothetical protein